VLSTLALPFKRASHLLVLLLCNLTTSVATVENLARRLALIVPAAAGSPQPARAAVLIKPFSSRSTMMTSNRPIEEWGKLLSDVSAAGAILDRLLHHAEIFKTSLEMSAFS
jgi:IstB-like ATP binding protein